MRRLFFLALLGCAAAWAQSSTPATAPPANDKAQPPASDSKAGSESKSAKAKAPDLSGPRSDRVDASALGDIPGDSSSKDTQIDLSPPENDNRAHPSSGDALVDEGSGSTDPNAFRYWDPHRAAKNVEVGDFYFKKKNYRAAESRYREALLYKDNDAIATFRLAECLEKQDRRDEALEQYENYLKILPHGAEAETARKAIEKLRK